MRFGAHEGHAQGRPSDGEDGTAVEKELRQGQVGTLQASGEKDQKNDPKGQATRRKNAS